MKRNMLFVSYFTELNIFSNSDDKSKNNVNTMMYGICLFSISCSSRWLEAYADFYWMNFYVKILYPFKQEPIVLFIVSICIFKFYISNHIYKNTYVTRKCSRIKINHQNLKAEISSLKKENFFIATISTTIMGFLIDLPPMLYP